jgi:hypothetical protein
LPESYKALLRYFNGGNIFDPVTLIYGIGTDIDYCFTEINKNQATFSIPNNYFIIAKHNYEDFICLNFFPPFDVIQWDNLKKEKYLTWINLDEWLETLLKFGTISNNTENNQLMINRPNRGNVNVSVYIVTQKSRL